MPRRAPESTEDVLLAALEEVAGAAMVLDAELRVVGVTEAASELVGSPVGLGTLAPKVLCGEGDQRPVAEALAEGRAVSAEVMRPGPTGGLRPLTVRAVPLGGEDRVGFLLLLDAPSWEVSAPDAPVRVWGILTRDPGMKRLLRHIERVASRNVTALVRGETGTGKELVARAIHEASSRKDGPFRAINCAALPPNLLESELFGHVRGAFTGAVRDMPGHFRLAEGGTLFLDEVGELSLELQAKLLRVLEERVVVPVGGREPVPVDVRIVSATHRALRSAVDEGTFRADLMYRLRVVPLYIPPLRDRVGDVALLSEHFVTQLNEPGGRVVERISEGALALLQEYAWPGNVRELANVMEYAYIMGDGPVITEADLPPEVRGEEPEVGVAHNVPRAPELALDLPPEARRIAIALERAAGHRERAAKSLGVSRVTLWRKMKQYGLDEGGEGDDDDSG